MFSLSQSVAGWSENVIYNFRPQATENPDSVLTLGADQALYGVAGQSIFRLQPPALPGGAWTEQVIGSFPRGLTTPSGQPVFDQAGTLYETSATNPFRTPGNLTRFSPPAGGGLPWERAIVHRFAGSGLPTEEPYGGVVRGADGTLYGAVGAGGGQNGYIFAYRP